MQTIHSICQAKDTKEQPSQDTTWEVENGFLVHTTYNPCMVWTARSLSCISLGKLLWHCMLPHLIERYVYYAMIRLMIVTEKRESFKYVHSSLICECSRDLLGRRFVRRRGRCAFASLSRVPSVVSRKVKTMATLLWIIIGLLLQRALGIKDRCEAHATTARILENNEPQALILSGDEANSFISTSVHVR